MMNKEMNALELSERLTARPDVYAQAAADTLRRQHEAIKQLREVLYRSLPVICDSSYEYLWKALKDTEEFK